MKKNIVVLGGGNGPAISLQALKKYTDKLNISAIITMFDTGGSTGRLRKEFGVLPGSDIMRAVLSLSKYDYKILRQIFYKNRFDDTGKLAKHNLGNLFMTLTSYYDGDIRNSIRALSQSVEARGDVFPVSIEKAELVVELSDGSLVKSECNIDEPTGDRSLRIKKMWIEPKARVYEPAAEVIKKADWIILGPGSVYTSDVANLVVDGVKEAIEQSQAKLIYLNGHFYANDKELGPTTLSEKVSEIEQYLPRPFDIIVYDDYVPNADDQKIYNEKKWVFIPKDVENLPGRNLLKRDIMEHGGGMSYEKLIPLFKEILL